MTLARLAIATALCAATLLPGTDDPVLLASRRGGSPRSDELGDSRDHRSRPIPRLRGDGRFGPIGKAAVCGAPIEGPAESVLRAVCDGSTSLQLTFLAEPAIRSIATFDRVGFQRGNVGIESFDTRNLARLATLKTPGVYQMKVSPDGRWLFGTTSFQGASLDLFDLPQGKMVWQHPFDDVGQDLHGAWIGQEYYLFSADRRGMGGCGP